MCNNLTYFYDVLTSNLKNKIKIKSTLKLWNDNAHSRLNMNVFFKCSKIKNEPYFFVL